MPAPVTSPRRHPLPARPHPSVAGGTGDPRPVHRRALSNATEASAMSRRGSTTSAMGASPVLVSPNPGMTPLRRLGKLADVVLDQPRIDNLTRINALRQPLAQAPIFALLADDVAHRSAAVEDLRQWSGEALREVMALEELLLTHGQYVVELKQQKLQASRPQVCGLIAATMHLCGRAAGRAVVEAALDLVEPSMTADERGRMLLVALTSALSGLAANEGCDTAQLTPIALKRRCNPLLKELRRATTSRGNGQRLRKKLMQELGQAITKGKADKLQLPVDGRFEYVEREECIDADAAVAAVGPWAQDVAAAPAPPQAQARGLASYFGGLWGSRKAQDAPPPYSAT